MYRPERVQFYCVAASGPQLAAVADLPHVAAVVSHFDTEGVNRLLATVRNIVDERERMFAARGLDMPTVREAKFGPNPQRYRRRGRRCRGGDRRLGELHRSDAQAGRHGDGLMRARNYGVRVVITHTSYLSGIRTGDPRAETSAEAGAAHDRSAGVRGRRVWTA